MSQSKSNIKSETPKRRHTWFKAHHPWFLLVIGYVLYQMTSGVPLAYFAFKDHFALEVLESESSPVPGTVVERGRERVAGTLKRDYVRIVPDNQEGDVMAQLVFSKADEIPDRVEFYYRKDSGAEVLLVCEENNILTAVIALYLPLALIPLLPFYRWIGKLTEKSFDAESGQEAA